MLVYFDGVCLSNRLSGDFGVIEARMVKNRFPCVNFMVINEVYSLIF